MREYSLPVSLEVFFFFPLNAPSGLFDRASNLPHVYLFFEDECVLPLASSSLYDSTKIWLAPRFVPIGNFFPPTSFPPPQPHKPQFSTWCLHCGSFCGFLPDMLGPS